VSEPPRRPKRLGRPPLDPNDHSVELKARVPSRIFDEVYRRAQARRQTMPELLRGMVRSWLRQDAARGEK
jgi:hypothetical protein